MDEHGRLWFGLLSGRRGRLALAAAVAVVACCADGEQGEQGGPRAVPHVAQAHPQSCLIAATTMVLRAHGEPAEHDALWAEVRSWREGTTVLEVQDLLAARGFEGLAFRSDEAELARIVEAGWPAIAVVHWPQKHAIVVERQDPETGAWRLLDPKADGPADEDAATFRARWEATGREAFLIRRAGDRGLARAGVDLARIEAESRRTRATELALRALLHGGEPVVPFRPALLLGDRAEGAHPE